MGLFNDNVSTIEDTPYRELEGWIESIRPVVI
jgi:hypothetical protein